MSGSSASPAQHTKPQSESISNLGFRDNPTLVFLIVLAGFLIHEVGEHALPPKYSGLTGHLVTLALVVSVVGIWAFRLLKSHKDVRSVLLGEMDNRRATESQLIEAVQELNVSVGVLDSRTQQLEALSSAMQKVQACESEESMCSYLASTMPEVLPGSSGAFYLLGDSFFDLVAQWPSETGLPARLLRRNWLRGLRNAEDAESSEHWHPAEPLKGWKQLPIKAGTAFVGMIQIRNDAKADEQTQVLILKMLAEQVNTSLSNLHLRESLTRQALRDPLTSLYNRRFMEETLNREMLRATREKGPLALIMFDLDHFKKLNDTYGHAIGDLVLKRVAEAAMKNIRGHDVACRYGGEEFVVILPGAAAVVAMQRAEQIRWAIRELKFDVKSKERLRVTSSFGVAAFPKNGSTVKAVLAACDGALYESKTAGRNRVTLAE